MPANTSICGKAQFDPKHINIVTVMYFEIYMQPFLWYHNFCYQTTD